MLPGVGEAGRRAYGDHSRQRRRVPRGLASPPQRLGRARAVSQEFSSSSASPMSSSGVQSTGVRYPCSLQILSIRDRSWALAMWVQFHVSKKPSSWRVATAMCTASASARRGRASPSTRAAAISSTCVSISKAGTPVNRLSRARLDVDRWLHSSYVIRGARRRKWSTASCRHVLSTRSRDCVHKAWHNASTGLLSAIYPAVHRPLPERRPPAASLWQLPCSSLRATHSGPAAGRTGPGAQTGRIQPWRPAQPPSRSP